jgi:hypothetical protein
VTSIVGIACVDGVVVGTDSSSTFGAANIRTIEQPTNKIHVISDQVIVAGTGPVGLGQRFAEHVGTAWGDGSLKNKSPLDVARHLSRGAIADFASTHAKQGQYGALVAYPCGSTPHLCEFAVDDFQPEMKDDRIWYVSLGSAQLITDPFLGFLREVFWSKGRPKLQDAIFCVTWALDQAVSLNPGGVKGPIRLAVLERSKGSWRARTLPDDELALHRQNVEEAKSHLRGFKDRHQAAEGVELPEVPKT